MYAEFTKKKVFELLTIGAGSPVRHRHGRQKVSILLSVVSSVLKIAILMLACQCPIHSIQT